MVDRPDQLDPDDVNVLMIILKFRKAYADWESATTDEARAELSLLIDRMREDWLAEFGRDDLYDMAFGTEPGA